MSSEKQRLQKILAQFGFASRRGSEEMIRNGEVTINGKIAKLGDKASLSDHIKVNGKLIRAKSSPNSVVVALFKPRGVLSVRPQDQIIERGTIFELIPKVKEKVFPIGKLDSDCEGIILLTNDGDLCERLNKSKFEVPKVYRIKIDGHLDPKKIKRLESGRMSIEGRKVKSAKISGLRESEGKQWLLIETTESQNRIVRKMIESVGHPIDKLCREQFASIKLGAMQRGEYRYLTQKEINRLKEQVGL